MKKFLEITVINESDEAFILEPELLPLVIEQRNTMLSTQKKVKSSIFQTKFTFKDVEYTLCIC